MGLENRSNRIKNHNLRLPKKYGILVREEALFQLKNDSITRLKRSAIVEVRVCNSTTRFLSYLMHW